MKISISAVAEHVDKEVTLKGWIHNKRSSGSIAFLELRDGTGFIQAVGSKKELDESAWDIIDSLTQESSVHLIGTISKHPKKENVFELQLSGIELVHKAEEYPITKKEHGPDFLLSNRHLWLRSKRQWAVLRIRDAVQMAISEYMHKQDFIRTDSPIFTPNACEDSTELFTVPYFDLGEAFLSQSGQLYIEAAIASVGRCYDFGPVFRAEKSVTKRHLTEFWMMDAEGAFVDHDDNVAIQEGLIKHIAKYCLEHCTKEFEVLGRDVEPLKKMVELPFTRYTYAEAITKLNELGSDIKFGDDLGNDDEGMLTKDSDVPVFIEKWPKNIKPFYMKIDPEDPERVLNNDLIGIEGSGEIIGGSEREDNYDLLMERIKEEGLTGSEYDWYSDLRKYGSVPHSGFGLGLERVVRWISGVEHIRECIPFPRLVNRIKP